MAILTNLRGSTRKAVLALFDMLCFFAVNTFYFFLSAGVEFSAPVSDLPVFWTNTLLLLAGIMCMRLLLKVYRTVWRYTSTKAYFFMVLADFFGGIIAMTLAYMMQTYRGVWHFMVVASLTALSTLMARFCYRLIYKYSRYDEQNPNFKEQGEIILPAEQVLHIPGLGFDGLVGYSPIAMAKNAIGMAIACEEYGAKFFANGAAPGGVLEHPGTIKDPARVRESWQAAFGGSSNSNKVAVLEEGMKYTPISISPEQAQFLETRKFQINEIARIFRVPPHMVGDLEKSSFSNIEQQSLEFVKYTLDPWIIRWEQSMARVLLSLDEKKDLFIKFNLEGLLRGDYQSRMNGYSIARQNGWMSANDIRELENLDRIPTEQGGDLYLINGSMLPLGHAGAYADINPTETEETNEDPSEEVLGMEKPGGRRSARRASP